MRYFDTSFLGPHPRREEQFPISRVVGGLPAGELAISRWTEVAFASLSECDVCLGGLRGDEAREADAMFEAVVRQSFVVLTPGADDFALARRYLHKYETRLRGGDALHPEIAGNSHADAIYSLDKSMIKAGKILDLPVSMEI